MLEITLFVTGAGIMIVELTGSRVLATFAGSSIFVWTSLIGIILASLSLGYWLGGKIADRRPTKNGFAIAVILAGVLVAVIPLIKDGVFEVFAAIRDVRVAAPLATIFIFAPASLVLGGITPYATRLKISTVSSSGSVVGRLYAISTVGSIAGTFLTGFYLIPSFNQSDVFYFLGAVLLFTGTTVSSASKKIKFGGYCAALLLIFAIKFLSAGASTLQSGIVEFETDTAYNHIMIARATDPASGRKIRYLATDPVTVQSVMFIDDPEELAAEYTKYYKLIENFLPGLERVLMVGGGGYSYPKDFLRNFPEATIDVVEIDGKITDLAKKYFALEENPRLVIYNEDGRVFLNKTTSTYDAILIDAFSGCTPPYQITTKEAVQKMNSALKENGLVITNVIGSIGGDTSEFLRAEYETYRLVFPYVYLLPVSSRENEKIVQNIMLFGAKRPLDFANLEKNNVAAPYPDNPLEEITGWSKILTDERAPSEYYSRKICSARRVF